MELLSTLELALVNLEVSDTRMCCTYERILQLAKTIHRSAGNVLSCSQFSHTHRSKRNPLNCLQHSAVGLAEDIHLAARRAGHM